MSCYKDVSECQTAGELLTALAIHYEAMAGAIDETEDAPANAAHGRAKALANTCHEVAGILGDDHTAVAYRTFLALGALQAKPDYHDPRGIGASLSAKATQGEILALSGGCPRDLDVAGARAVAHALGAWVSQAIEGAPAETVGRLRALQNRWARETVALWDVADRMEIQAEAINDTCDPGPASRN